MQSGTAKDTALPWLPGEVGSPKVPGALICPQRQELGSRGALLVASHRHRWAEPPGESLGPQALAGMLGQQALIRLAQLIPTLQAPPPLNCTLYVQVGLPHIAQWLESAGFLSCP